MTIPSGHFKAGRSLAQSAATGSVPIAGNAALAHLLIDQGHAILPLDQKKRPLTPRGFHDARQVASPWRDRPEALIGIPTAGFWVLDIDPPLEASVQALCALLRWEWRELTARCGCIVRTPRGGFHLYWKRTPGVAIRTAANDITAGVDSRGHDEEGRPTGFIVAPGCVLQDGRGYVVDRGSLEEMTEAPARLMWLASFSRAERGRIVASPDLSAAMRTAEPSAWRGILETHQASMRAELPALTPDDAEPMRRQAAHDLEAERQGLSRLTEGRRNAVFESAARLARYAANGVLTDQEVQAGLLEGWMASGAGSKHGLDYPRGAIRRALEKGRNDPLPPLARRFRGPSGRAGG